MGWSLTSRSTKDCGCRVETKEHDDFPTRDTSIILCEQCSKLKKEKEERRKQERTDRYNRFIQEVNNTDVQIVPQKEAYNIVAVNRFRFMGSTSVLSRQLMYSMFKYEQVRNRYYIDINAVKLFYEYELDKYYSFTLI